MGEKYTHKKNVLRSEEQTPAPDKHGEPLSMWAQPLQVDD